MRLAAAIAGGLDKGEHLVGGIALLGREAPVLDQEGIQLGFEGTEDRCRAWEGAGVGPRLGGGKGLADRLARNVLLTGDLADGLVLDIVGMADGSTFFHWYHLHLW
jgi:hypothetical protein